MKFEDEYGIEYLNGNGRRYFRISKGPTTPEPGDNEQMKGNIVKLDRTRRGVVTFTIDVKEDEFERYIQNNVLNIMSEVDITQDNKS